MKQKVAVARALLHRPELVFLDEPTAGLDPVAAASLRDDLASLTTREGATVFITTHNLAEAEKLCGRVGVIRRGQLVAMGSPAELRSRQSVPRLEITGSGFTPEVATKLAAQPDVTRVQRQDDRLVIDLRAGTDSSPLVALVVSAGARVDEVRRASSSLEDVFLALMEEEK